jgi:hypothetical protein
MLDQMLPLNIPGPATNDRSLLKIRNALAAEIAALDERRFHVNLDCQALLSQMRAIGNVGQIRNSQQATEKATALKAKSEACALEAAFWGDVIPVLPKLEQFILTNRAAVQAEKSVREKTIDLVRAKVRADHFDRYPADKYPVHEPSLQFYIERHPVTRGAIAHADEIGQHDGVADPGSTAFQSRIENRLGYLASAATAAKTEAANFEKLATQLAEKEAQDAKKTADAAAEQEKRQIGWLAAAKSRLGLG